MSTFITNLLRGFSRHPFWTIVGVAILIAMVQPRLVENLFTQALSVIAPYAISGAVLVIIIGAFKNMLLPGGKKK